MKLKSEFNDPNNLVKYYLDTHDGMHTVSSMPATVAEEMAKRAKTLEMCDEEGFELVVNGDTHLPISIFDIEDGEVEYKAPKKTPARKAATAKKTGE